MKRPGERAGRRGHTAGWRHVSAWPSPAALLSIGMALITFAWPYPSTGAEEPPLEEISFSELTQPDSWQRAQADLALYAGALEAARRQENRPAEAEALYALALTRRSLGRLDSALVDGEKALRLFDELQDKVGAAAAADLVGALQAQNGREQAARVAFEKALELRRALSLDHPGGDRSDEAASLHNLASLELESGHAAAALERLEQVLDLHRRSGDHAAQAAALNNLGLAWLRLGRGPRARGHLEESARLYQRRAEIPADRRGLAGVQTNLGLLAFVEKQYDDAAHHFEAALAAWRHLGEIRGEAEALGNLGLVELERGDPPRARRLLESALELAERHRLRRAAASHRGSLGRLERRQGRLEEAVATLNASLLSLEELGATRSQAMTLFDLAIAHRQKGEGEIALGKIQTAIEHLETLRSPLSSSETLAHSVASERYFYDLEVELLIELGRPRRALEATERARARGLLHLLSLVSDPPPRPNPAPSFDLESLGEARDPGTTWLVYYLGRYRARAFLLDSEGLKIYDLGAVEEIEELASAAYQNLARSLERSRRGPAILAARALAERILDPLRLDGRSLEQARRLIVVPDGGLHRIPFSALPIQLAPNDLLSAGDASLVDRYEIAQVPSLSVLSALTERRSAATLPSGEGGSASAELAILADPIFHVDDERWRQVGGHPAPSALLEPSSDPAQTRGEQRGRSELAATFRRLPWSGVEAENIASLFAKGDVELLLGFDATGEVLMENQLRHSRRLHFATHTVIDDRAPERSGLVFSPWNHAGEPRRGFIGLRDLFSLRLDAELITLSSCRSALGPSIHGEGLVGLSYGFFAAGARQLVLSLWDVDDRATSEWMGHFYRAIAAGHEPITALAEAQRTMRRDPRWSAPFYWAGFVLIGDWR